MTRVAVILALATSAALTSCNQAAPEPQVQETRLPDEFKQKRTARPAVAAEGVTAMEDRVATLGLLNKRNNITQDLALKPGESQRIGDVIVRVAACERTAPWEMPKETGAFVQVLVRKRGSSSQFDKVFSGWLFKNSPSLNVVEHPIYDVWVKDCTMAFPGEEATPGNAGAEGKAKPAAKPSPKPSVTPSATTAPAPTASAGTPANQPTD